MPKFKKKSKTPKVVDSPKKPEKREKEKDVEKEEFVEIDAEATIRPDSFFLEKCNGILVTVQGVSDGKVAYQTVMYLNESEKRSRVAVKEGFINLADESYFLQAPNYCENGWSRQSREDWLAGGDYRNTFVDDLRGSLKKHLYFAEEVWYDVLLCYILLSYCYNIFSVLGYLWLNGRSGAGKSTTIKVLNETCFRPLTASNTSGAALFRSVDSGRTVLLDEAEQLGSSGDDFSSAVNNVLLSGVNREGKVIRCGSKESGFSPTVYKVFGPKVMAGINDLRGPLRSRCIALKMSKAPEGMFKGVEVRETDWQAHRDVLHVFWMNKGQEFYRFVENYDEDFNLSNRGYDNWRPLIAIGRFLQQCGIEFDLDRLIETAIESNQETESDSFDPKLKILLECLVSRLGLPGKLKLRGETLSVLNSMTCTDLLNAARDKDFAMFRDMNAKGVSALLKGVGIKTSAKKIKGAPRYTKAMLEQVKQLQDETGINFGA